MNYDDIMALMQEAVDSLYRAELVEEAIKLNKGTVLLGDNSALDSMGFVTFITEIEERVEDKTGIEFVVVIDKLHEFNEENSNLSIGSLILFIESEIGK